MPNLEVIACTLEDALAAQAGGADSLELCVDLPNDGLTPPLDVVQHIRDAVRLPLHVMLRPHARDFVYSAADMEVMLAQVAAFKSLGIQSVVFGAHTPDGRLDLPTLLQIIQAAAPLPVTLHRALDRSSNAAELLPQLVGVVPRLLTSGSGGSASEGASVLAQWVVTYGNAFEFVVAGGVNAETIIPLYQQIHAPTYHVGSAARTHNRVDTAKVIHLRRLLP
jgi:copper homeostasis protein